MKNKGLTLLNCLDFYKDCKGKLIISSKSQIPSQNKQYYCFPSWSTCSRKKCHHAFLPVLVDFLWFFTFQLSPDISVANQNEMYINPLITWFKDTVYIFFIFCLPKRFVIPVLFSSIVTVILYSLLYFISVQEGKKKKKDWKFDLSKPD